MGREVRRCLRRHVILRVGVVVLSYCTGVLEQALDVTVQPVVFVVADQWRRDGDGDAIQGSEGRRQIVERSAQDTDVLGVAQVGDQSGLSGLLLEVTGQMRSTQSAAQVLLVATEQVLDDVVGARHDREDAAVLITASGMFSSTPAATDEVQMGQAERERGILVAVSLQQPQDERKKLFANQTATRLPLVAVISPRTAQLAQVR